MLNVEYGNQSCMNAMHNKIIQWTAIGITHTHKHTNLRLLIRGSAAIVRHLQIE